MYIYVCVCACECVCVLYMSDIVWHHLTVSIYGGHMHATTICPDDLICQPFSIHKRTAWAEARAKSQNGTPEPSGSERKNGIKNAISLPTRNLAFGTTPLVQWQKRL